MHGFAGAALAALVAVSAPVALAANDSDAEDLIGESRCTKCHAVAREKVGPPFREVAAKYKGKADAVAVVTRHVTVPNEVDIDGEKKAHGLVETSDPVRIRNLVEWILSR